ncbi:hypothetical protein IJ847_01990 [Candidatus Saccharibacteria bacterium]|nr:hypothetical protein [Candidatus Saccharibacteria bacterium]
MNNKTTAKQTAGLNASVKDQILCLAEGFLRTMLLTAIFILSNLLANSAFGANKINEACQFNDESLPVLTTTSLVAGLIIAVALRVFTHGKSQKKIAFIFDIVPFIFALLMTGWLVFSVEPIRNALVGITDALTSEGLAARCGHKIYPSWIWLAVCVCAALGFALRKPGKKQIAFFLIGVVAASVITILASGTIEHLAFGQYNCMHDVPCLWALAGINNYEIYRAAACICGASSIILLIVLVSPVIRYIVEKGRKR